MWACYLGAKMRTQHPKLGTPANVDESKEEEKNVYTSISKDFKMLVYQKLGLWGQMVAWVCVQQCVDCSICTPQQLRKTTLVFSMTNGKREGQDPMCPVLPLRHMATNYQRRCRSFFISSLQDLCLELSPVELWWSCLSANESLWDGTWNSEVADLQCIWLVVKGPLGLQSSLMPPGASVCKSSRTSSPVHPVLLNTLRPFLWAAGWANGHNSRPKIILSTLGAPRQSANQQNWLGFIYPLLIKS